MPECDSKRIISLKYVFFILKVENLIQDSFQMF